jgi:hypothetical protein
LTHAILYQDANQLADIFLHVSAFHGSSRLGLVKLTCDELVAFDKLDAIDEFTLQIECLV